MDKKRGVLILGTIGFDAREDLCPLAIVEEISFRSRFFAMCGIRYAHCHIEIVVTEEAVGRPGQQQFQQRNTRYLP